MNKVLLLILVSIFSYLSVYASDGTVEPDDQIDDRWYTESQLRLGKNVFEKNCAVCHGYSGEGVVDDWKQPLADGSYPPPPLNGTAHTWHHPISNLLRTIDKGGVDLGGKMPPFSEKLSDIEKFSVIAYFQNWWPGEIYEAWIQRGGLTK